MSETLDSYELRAAIRRDVPSMAEIEQRTFEAPWGVTQLLQCLATRAVQGRVITLGPEVVGFVLYRRTVREFQILRLAVSPAHQRHGVGSRLLRAVSQCRPTAHPLGHRAFVPDTAMAGQRFFSRAGFRVVGTRTSEKLSSVLDYVFVFRPWQPQGLLSVPRFSAEPTE